MKSKILRLLKSAQGYVSGQELCDRFQVSRTAVWKAVNQLRSEGYEIQAVRNKGYCLVDVPDVMSRTELESGMPTKWAGRSLAFFEETDSTNIQARRLGEQGAVHGTLAVAEAQTSGRGRRGKTWVSPRGSSVFMSILLRPPLHPSKASMLTLVAALAVSEGIEAVTKQRCLIKWPNDLVLGGKKVCGILTEMQAEMEEIRYVVVGMGINVNLKSFPEEVSQVATSLYLESGCMVSRNQLIWASMEAFERYYHEFMTTHDMSSLIQTYESRLANRDKHVKVLAAKDGFQGICLGIDNKGELLVRTEDGQIRSVMSGEVSVRGLYGYVDE